MKIWKVFLVLGILILAVAIPFFIVFGLTGYNPFTEKSASYEKESLVAEAIEKAEGKGTSSALGTIEETKRIEILNQTYIDQYLNWDFTEIDNNTWTGNFSINEDLWNDVITCRNLPLLQRPACWNNLKNTYFPDFNLTQIIADLANMTNYPLRNLTKDISFSDFNINLTSGTGSFTINFPNGFKEGEYAELGFGTTSIGTTTSATPFDAYVRAVCRTTNRIHAVWNSGTRTAYTNSTDGVTWNTAVSLDGSPAADNIAVVPSITCSGNRVFVAWINSTAALSKSTIYYMNSTDEGGTWSSYIGNIAPRWRANIESLYNNVGGISFGNNDNVWVTFNNETTGNQQISISNSTSYGGDLPTLTTKQLTGDWGASGVASIYVNVTNGNEGVWVATSSGTDNDLYFNWSIDSGSTWSGSTIATGTYTKPSLTLFNNTFYVVNEQGSTDFDIVVWNTTDPTNWGTGMAIYNSTASTSDDGKLPVVTNTSNNLYVFYNLENGTANYYNVSYNSWNITNGWSAVLPFDKTDSTTGHPNVNINSMNGTAVDILFANETGTDTVYYGVVNEVPVPAEDITPPTFSNMKANTTVAGSSVNFSVVINDETGLSGYIFETNNTGNYVNTTWVSLASGGTASNITTLNSTVDANVSWNFYANDSSDNWAVVKNNTITTSAGVSQIRNATDGITYNEISSLRGNFRKMQSQQINYNELEARKSLIFKIQSQEISYGESILKVGKIFKSITDSFNYNELRVGTFSSIRIISEQLSYNEMILKKLLSFKILSQEISYNEMIQRIGKLSITAADGFTYGEGIFRNVVTGAESFIRVITDSLNYNELMAIQATFKKTVSQILNYNEIILKRQNLVRSISQQINYDEITVNIRKFFKSVTDFITYGEGMARIVTTPVAQITVYIRNDTAQYTNQNVSTTYINLLTSASNITFTAPSGTAYLYINSTEYSVYNGTNLTLGLGDYKILVNSSTNSTGAVYYLFVKNRNVDYEMAAVAGIMGLSAMFFFLSFTMKDRPMQVLYFFIALSILVSSIAVTAAVSTKEASASTISLLEKSISVGSWMLYISIFFFAVSLLYNALMGMRVKK